MRWGDDDDDDDDDDGVLYGDVYVILYGFIYCSS